MTAAELTIPALIDGGAVEEVGPEALTLPGALVESLRPVRLSGDHYTPAVTPAPRPTARSRPPPLPGMTRPPPLPGMTRPRQPADTGEPTVALAPEDLRRSMRKAAPKPSGESPTAHYVLRTDTVFLSSPPEEETGSALIGAPGGSRSRRPRRRIRERRGLQALLFAEKPEPTRRGPPLRSTILVMVAICSVLALGTMAGRLVRTLRTERLASRAQAQASAARGEGTLWGFLSAAARYGEVLSLAPADGAALRARAALLAEAVYEFGGAAALAEDAGAAVRLVQGDATAVGLSAQVYLLLYEGDRGGAEARLSALSETEEHSAGAGRKSYLEGQLALVLGEDETALKKVEWALHKNPGQPLWHLARARLLSSLGRGETAMGAIREALRQSPRHPGALVARACEDAPALRRLHQADKDAAPAVKAEGWVCLAEQAILANPPERGQARAALAEARALAPPPALLLRERLVRALLALRDRAGAETEAEALVQRAPQRASAILLLARTRLLGHKAQGALEALQPLLVMHRPEAQLLRAQALQLLDETLEAQGLLRQVEARAAGALRSDAQLGLARIALLQGEREEARRLLGQLALSPKPAQRREAEILRAKLLLSARPKETAAAQALLLSVLAEAKEQPEQLEAHHLLARMFRDAGQLRAAREQLQRALQIDDQPELRRELAQLALDEGDPALARKQYELLLQSDVQDPELLIQAARAYRLSGDGAGALKVLGAIRGVRPGEAALIEEARALLQLGRGAEVVALLREPARSARRATVPALLLRAYLAVPGGSAPAQALLAGLAPAHRRDAELQIAEARLLLNEGESVAAQLRLSEVLQRLPTGRTGEVTDLRAEALDLLEQAKRR